MTEAEALDEAAKAAGWRDWKDADRLAERGEIEAIRAHAKTLMENAALKRECDALRALQEGGNELLTIAWMDGARRSNKAHREQVAALKAENERLRQKLELIALGMSIELDEEDGPVQVWLDADELSDIARTALERIDHGDR